jgi:hypothetical protein
MSVQTPRPWEIAAYGSTLVISLLMAVIGPAYIKSHCEWVYTTTGIQGACGLGAGWLLFTLAFLAIAVYSAWQLYELWKARNKGA